MTTMTIEKATDRVPLTAMKEARKRKGLKFVELGEIVGCHPSYLCKLETGERTNPNGRLAVKLAKALDVDVALFYPDVPDHGEMV